MPSCCLTINPLFVSQYDQNESAHWSPIAEGQSEPAWESDWDTAFDEINLLTAYPEELKQECYQADDAETFTFTAVYEDDINCDPPVNPYNQAVHMRFKLTVCKPIRLFFTATGNVEREDEHFDWIRVTRWPVIGSGAIGDRETILYEHGTNEGISCEMADIDCCKGADFDPGQYYLDIDQATGDGLHHTDHAWSLAMKVDCSETASCPGGSSLCSSDGDDFPLDPPNHDLPDPGGPPNGHQAPGPENPEPGLRWDCNCEACQLFAIGVQVTGLPSSSCIEEHFCNDVENYQESNNLNGGYVLSKNPTTGVYEQLLGTLGDHDDPGIRVGYQKWLCHNEGLSCPLHGVGDQGTCIEAEIYCWKISGTLTCIDCELGEVPGSQWAGTLTFHFQCRSRSNLAPPPDDEFAWSANCSAYWWDCPNYLFDQLVEQICEVPPGCFGSVTYDNGANLVHEFSGPNCGNCVVDASTATAKLTAIGLTELCDPPV
jgi:hypothetical protein